MITKYHTTFLGLLLAALSACTVNVFLPPVPSEPVNPTALPPVPMVPAPSTASPATSATATLSAPCTDAWQCISPSPTPSHTPAGLIATPSAAPSATPHFLPSVTPTRLPFSSVAPPVRESSTQPSPEQQPSPPPAVMFPPKSPIPTLPVPSASPTAQTSPTVAPIPRSYSIAFVLTASKSVIFTPRSLSINSGDTVTWKNVYSTAQTLISNDQLFGDQYLNPGASFSYTFTKSGKYSVIVRLGSGSQSVIVN